VQYGSRWAVLIDLDEIWCGVDGCLLKLLLLLLMCRWAVPITRDDLDMVCGIDGCF
jgi:hypothetical protein